jgi:hypothetical protein
VPTSSSSSSSSQFNQITDNITNIMTGRLHSPLEFI